MTNETSILPNLPKMIGASEEKIERHVERLMDLADAILMRGDFTQAEYDAWTKRLDVWAFTCHK